MIALQKDGASIPARPAVYPHVAGSRDDMTVSAKIRALFDVLGPCIVRLADGRMAQVAPDALKIISPVHEGLSA